MNYSVKKFNKYDKIIEHIYVGGSSKSENSQEITTTSSSSNETNINNTSNISSEQNIDSSMNTQIATETNTQIDNSQTMNTTNINDNRSETNINNRQDNYNIDQSSVSNETQQNIESKMYNSCGAQITDVEQAVNIVEDNSINTAVDASNVVINTGDNATLSGITLSSSVVFSSPTVDRSCMLEAMQELDAHLDSVNENSKSFTGGVGGETSGKSGGNTNTNETSAEKKDQVDAGVDASFKGKNAPTVDQGTNNLADQGSDVSNTQKNDQGIEATASASAGGGLSSNIFIVIIVIVGLLFLNENKMEIDEDTLNNLLILLVLLFFYFKFIN